MRSLHERLSGAHALAQECPLVKDDGEPLFNMALDLRTRIVVSKESRTTIASAVVSSHDGQKVLVRPGTYGWKGRLVVRRTELHGERLVDIAGEKGNDYVVLQGGKRVQLGSQMIGRWDVRPLTLGRMAEVTLFYNATDDVVSGVEALKPEEGVEMLDLDRSATMFVDNATWQFERCQVRSVGGIALSASGKALVAALESRLGGMGPRVLACDTSVCCDGQAVLAFEQSTLEHAAMSALHVDWEAEANLEASLVTNCRVGVSLARAGYVSMHSCRAINLAFAFCHVLEGDVVGTREEEEEEERNGVVNMTCLGLYNCEVTATLFQGYGRPGQFEMEGTRHEGAYDGVEKDRMAYQDLTRRSIAAAMARGESVRDVEDPEAVTRERYREIKRELLDEMAVNVFEYMTGNEVEGDEEGG